MTIPQIGSALKKVSNRSAIEEPILTTIQNPVKKQDTKASSKPASKQAVKSKPETSDLSKNYKFKKK